jgi:hypothetical protein
MKIDQAERSVLLGEKDAPKYVPCISLSQAVLFFPCVLLWQQILSGHLGTLS